MTSRQIRFAGALARCGTVAGARAEEPFSDSWLYVLMHDERFVRHLRYIGVDPDTVRRCVRESEEIVCRAVCARRKGDFAMEDDTADKGVSVRGEKMYKWRSRRGNGAAYGEADAAAKDRGDVAASCAEKASADDCGGAKASGTGDVVADVRGDASARCAEKVSADDCGGAKASGTGDVVADVRGGASANGAKDAAADSASGEAASVAVNDHGDASARCAADAAADGASGEAASASGDSAASAAANDRVGVAMNGAEDAAADSRGDVVANGVNDAAANDRGGVAARCAASDAGGTAARCAENASADDCGGTKARGAKDASTNGAGDAVVSGAKDAAEYSAGCTATGDCGDMTRAYNPSVGCGDNAREDREFCGCDCVDGASDAMTDARGSVFANGASCEAASGEGDEAADDCRDAAANCAGDAAVNDRGGVAANGAGDVAAGARGDTAASGAKDASANGAASDAGGTAAICAENASVDDCGGTKASGDGDAAADGAGGEAASVVVNDHGDAAASGEGDAAVDGASGEAASVTANDRGDAAANCASGGAANGAWDVAANVAADDRGNAAVNSAEEAADGASDGAASVVADASANGAEDAAADGAGGDTANGAGNVAADEAADDRGGVAASGAEDGAEDGAGLISEIRGLRTAVMRDTSLKLSDRLGAASALERSFIDFPPGQTRAAAPFRIPADVVGRAFVDINRRIVPNVSYVFTGGRCSGKSSFIALKIVELLINCPTLHACAVRKFATTLRDSVYAQLEWAIRTLGLADRFRFRSSPLEIVYAPTGQTVYFRGVDDAAKLKSTKPPFGSIGILWREEEDQLAGPDEVRGIAQSVLRGGDAAYDFSSYNPPRSRKHWINAERPGAVRHHSTYLDLPPEWVGQKFIDDAEHLKETDPAAYEHEYLGVPNGAGGAVFDKLEVRRIEDAEVESFDRILQGIDFGWYPDPFAFLRLHYDAARGRIYLLDEIYKTKLSGEEAADIILSRGYDDERIVCDSAEPRSIAELRRHGVPAVGAVKGAGSVAFGFRWLAARRIVVDPARTPNAYRELVSYEFAADGGFPDRDDHAISALRYATERVRG